jgi:hypothetical protein
MLTVPLFVNQLEYGSVVQERTVHAAGRVRRQQEKPLQGRLHCYGPAVNWYVSTL